MFVTAYATLALAAVGSVSALVVPRKEPPKGWLANILEDYHVYHARYLALKCQDQHGKPFFDQCCHPLLKTQSLSSRPAQCTPSPSASASASAAEPTSTVSTPDDGEDDDCDDSTTASASAANPTSTSDDGEDEDDDDCDDSDDEPSTTEEGKTSTPHATKTQATTTEATSTHAPTTEATTTHAAKTTQAVTTTHKPSSTQSTAAPSKSASSNSGSSSTFSDGFATFFFQNGVAGACGTVHSDNDLIAAIDEQRYGNSGLKSSLCGKQVEITNPANGKSVVVTIVDDCPTCTNKDSIDLSVAAFKKIATEEEGMVKINWHFL